MPCPPKTARRLPRSTARAALAGDRPRSPANDSSSQIREGAGAGQRLPPGLWQRASPTGKELRMGAKHTVRFEPAGIEIEADEGETVLNAAFRQGVMLMHGCKEG